MQLLDGAEDPGEIYVNRAAEVRLDDYTPLGMRCKVVFLKNSSRMDTQSYLDKNSYLSTPERPAAGEMVLGGEYILE